MSDKPGATVIVVGDERGGGAAGVQEWLSAAGLTATRWLRPRDVDELPALLAELPQATVVFESLETLALALWNGELDGGAVLANAGRVCIAGTKAPDDDVAGPLLRAWGEFVGAHRRRRGIAGVILSIVAVAAAFAVLWAVAAV